jgi:phosphonate transport system ATP-binding protein
MSLALEIKHLSKSFAGKPALNDVSLYVEPGEMVALIGASGSGKSTLLRHIPGFIAADSGEVQVFGKSVQHAGCVSRSVRRLRREIGFVFQQFNLVGRLSVMTNVLIGLMPDMPWWRRMLVRFSVIDRRNAIRALSAVGIADTAWQRASTLSGGQQQRAALARCIVQQARLVLADEPIASLDPESSRKVMELLAQMNRDHGCTVLVSLHQVEFALQHCPRTVALRAGAVVYDGPSSALTPQLLRELYGAQAIDLFEPGTQQPVELTPLNTHSAQLQPA